MLHTSNSTATAAAPLSPDRSRDYELIRRAIAFLSADLDRAALAGAPGRSTWDSAPRTARSFSSAGAG